MRVSRRKSKTKRATGAARSGYPPKLSTPGLGRSDIPTRIVPPQCDINRAHAETYASRLIVCPLLALPINWRWTRRSPPTAVPSRMLPSRQLVEVRELGERALRAAGVIEGKDTHRFPASVQRGVEDALWDVDDVAGLDR